MIPDPILPRSELERLAAALRAQQRREAGDYPPKRVRRKKPGKTYGRDKRRKK